MKITTVTENFVNYLLLNICLFCSKFIFRRTNCATWVGSHSTIFTMRTFSWWNLIPQNLVCIIDGWKL